VMFSGDDQDQNQRLGFGGISLASQTLPQPPELST
jgi:hypothetical protein